MPQLLLTTLTAAILAPAQTPWQSLFDGKTLGQWKETPFTGHAAAKVEKGMIHLMAGNPMTGVTWTGAFPKTNYEIRFEGSRIAGGDFFASITFPVGNSYATWILGGWGGDIVGISSIDGWDASDNETRSYYNFETGKWYNLRLQVTDDRIQAWINGERIVNADIRGRAVSLRPGETRLCIPLGFMSYNTAGGIRNIEYRPITPKQD
jgi:hypothetical protein